MVRPKTRSGHGFYGGNTAGAFRRKAKTVTSRRRAKVGDPFSSSRRDPARDPRQPAVICWRRLCPRAQVHRRACSSHAVFCTPSTRPSENGRPSKGGNGLRDYDRQLADHIQTDGPAQGPGTRQRSRAVRGQHTGKLHHREVRQLRKVSARARAPPGSTPTRVIRCRDQKISYFLFYFS